MKNLEKEYKDQIDREVPDLWSRIEAGVDAYEAEKKASGTIESSTPVTETPTNITPIRKKNVISIITRITAVAACVLILAATVKVTQRTKSESTAPAADAAMSEMPQNTNEPENIQHAEEASEATEAPDYISPIAEAEVDEEPSNSYKPIAGADSDKNASPSLSPSESAVIKDPVTFDDARDDLLPQLEALGFKLITDFVFEDSVDKRSLADDVITDDIDIRVASFTDSKTSDKYYVVYTVNDDGAADILIVRKADNTGDILYTNPSYKNK